MTRGTWRLLHYGIGVPSLPAPRASKGRNELYLAAFVLSTVAMLVFVLPTWLLDVLLATNIALSVGVLVLVLYARDTLSLAAFPSVLLLTTLFRLALNVSSSRLILLQGDAGTVIRAFGGFVVRGNMLVGAVVFAVLTVVQFVVIAKGAERVAEVAARFSLDALPGKQLAIDAELRSGGISSEEARVRRDLLGRTSQFYGAMDGAMKFVKGDVIATVVIVLVNVVFGLLVGVVQRGMSIEAAAARYVLLAVGDGLVSQIPALVLSTAAGILVTRTSQGENAESLGDELFAQMFGSPRALATTGAFVLVLAIVPGLPAPPFVVLGAALLVGAYTIVRARASGGATLPARRFVPVLEPFSVKLGRALYASHGAAVTAGLDRMRDTIFADLGLPLPAIRCTESAEVGENEAVLFLFEVPAQHLTAPDPALAEAAILGAAEDLARRRAAELLGISEVQGLLDALAETAPAIVRNVVPKPVTVQLLTEVLRRLLDEQVSVRDLAAILDVLGSRAEGERDARELAEAVRGHLRRALTFRLTRGAPQLDVVMLDPMVEDAVRRGITRQGPHAFLALPPAQQRDLVTAVGRAIAECREAGAAPVLVASPDTRRFVRKLLETEAPDVPVLSHQELSPELVLRPRARAHLGGIG